MSKKRIQERIAFFKERCLVYAKLMNIKCEYFVLEMDQKENNEARARWIPNHAGAMVSIYYALDWISDETVDLLEIDKVAFHEVYESTLTEIRNYMLEFYSRDLVDKLTHENVRMIENLFLDYIGIMEVNNGS